MLPTPTALSSLTTCFCTTASQQQQPASWRLAPRHLAHQHLAHQHLAHLCHPRHHRLRQHPQCLLINVTVLPARRWAPCRAHRCWSHRCCFRRCRPCCYRQSRYRKPLLRALRQREAVRAAAWQRRPCHLACGTGLERPGGCTSARGGRGGGNLAAAVPTVLPITCTCPCLAVSRSAY